MRRAVRSLPVLVGGTVIGAVVAAVVALFSTPFLVRRLTGASQLEVRSLTLVLGIAGLVLGLMSGAVATLGPLVMRRPTDPPPRKPPARVSSGALLGALIGGFFGFALTPVLLALFARQDEGRFLLTPGRFLAVSLVVGATWGLAASAFVVALSPAIAPDRVRVRAQHLYSGPVTSMGELAVLVNRIKEGGEDAIAAGREFYLE